jgi:predicted deacetylase
MSTGLHTVLAALDAVPMPLTFFLRDDDAGWDDARLFALLDATESAGIPIDLAVIPQATGTALAAALSARKRAAPNLIGLHQHGYAHSNHETLERKCEFGPARSIDAQRRDLSAGREHLLGLFGAQLDAFFTPPWNRCSAATPALLAALGFSALSRSRGAEPQQALPELPVDVDWCKQQRIARERGEADGGTRIAAELAQRVAAGGPVGLMLHHAAMDDADLALLDVFLRTTRRHPKARWMPMRDLLRGSPPNPPPTAHQPRAKDLT